LGKAKRTALYIQFKTLDNIKCASIEELSMVKGIDVGLAKRIYEKFNNGLKGDDNDN